VTAWHVTCHVGRAMDIRIDIETEGPVVILSISGRLVDSVTNQLTDICEPIEGDLVLDLSNLQFADDAAARVIRALTEEGAEIRGASSFIKLLIDGNGNGKPRLKNEEF
jgi:anti-anti-sigma regulatory factor